MRHFGLIGLIAALATVGCKDARRGQSSANEAPVPDGHVVLLKRSNEVAAFILSNQKITPEPMDFSWFYRSDGKGTSLQVIRQYQPAWHPMRPESPSRPFQSSGLAMGMERVGSIFP